MSFLHLADKIRLRFGRYKVGAPTTNSQPGAHTGSSRQYIPGYSDSNIVYLDTVSGNDSNDGSTELLAKLTYASAATAAGSTKKIRVINDGAALSTNITKPTEMKRGVSGTILSSVSTMIGTWSETASNTFSGTVSYSPKFQKLFSANKYSSDGTTWTAYSASPTTGAKTYWSDRLQLGVAIAGSGEAWYSSDLNTWTQSANLGNNSWFVVIELNDVLYAYGTTGAVAKSTDGLTWELRKTSQPFQLGAYAATVYDGRVVIASDVYDGASYVAAVFTSTDGENFTELAAGFTTGYYCRSVAVVGSELWIGFGESGADNSFIRKTSDLVNFTTENFTTTDGDTYVSNIAEVKELSLIIVFIGPDANFFRYSISGGAFSSAAPSNLAQGQCLYIPILGKVFVDRGSRSSLSLAPANTISANVAGFTIQAMQYSGTVTAYNCTMYQPGTTAALSLNACRVTEPGAHISNNAQSHFGTLFEGDTFFTSAPASQNAFALNCNTFGGNVYLYNSSATNYEQIRDNVIVGDFTASFAAPMLSGNLQGTNTNGILAKAVTLSDPAFVNTTDYKLKRLTNGDSQDSPLCNAAVYYVNEQGQPRDMGAWSEDDSENAVDYRYSYFIDKPAGNGIRPQKIVAASADQGMDGTWDSVNEPERASEYLTITYSAAVSREHVTIQDLLESLIDMTCEVSLIPDLSDPDTAVTVNGNHSIGDIVLNIDASSTIKAGMVLPIGGVNYFILYTASGSSPTKLVLHKPLESAVSDNTVITPQEPTAYGTYQYIPQSREIPRPTKMETDYVNGVSFKFVRQYPQV